MPFPATVVANEFVAIAKASGQPLTPMKLQKLVYFAHGWYLALTERPLVSEHVEAWQYGPVIPAIYHEFKSSGNGPITSPATNFQYTGDGKFCLHSPSLDDFPEDEEKKSAKEIINRVFQIYGKYSAVQLSNATHLPGTPWKQIYKDGIRKLEIPDDVIKSYFQRLANAPAI